MKVYICGVDGYLGWALYKYLTGIGCDVRGCDNLFRRGVAHSLIPLSREEGVTHIFHLADYIAILRDLESFQPDAVVHFAEIPSAPYSMRDVYHAVEVQQHNVTGTIALIYAVKNACPEAHIVKLGTMGEYIPSSWYHLSKVHDTNNLIWACNTFGLRCTDVQQGPVYGVGGRFDYDEEWGTVINRWICMGLTDHPILVYGDGAQVRAMLPIEDSMQCFRIILENPPYTKTYRSIDQYADKYTLNYIAGVVSSFTGARIKYIDNPRVEKNSYHGDGGNTWLRAHGYNPSVNMEETVEKLVELVKPYVDGVDVSKFEPTIRWR